MRKLPFFNILIYLTFTSTGLYTQFEPGEYGPAPTPTPTPIPTPEPALTSSSTTKILPDGTVQIAPSQFFSPKLLNTSAGSIVSIKQTGKNKYDTAFSSKYLVGKATGASFIFRTVNHPAITGFGFSAFLSSLESAPDIIPYFVKFKVLALHDIYDHLMKVYTNFNMQHPKTLEEYVSSEQTNGLNKKILVINHLVNLIEAQTNGLIMQLFPTLSQDKASFVGNFMMQHESTSLEDMLLDLESELVASLSQEVVDNAQSMKTNFFNSLGLYLTFMDSYCALLDQEDPTQPNTGMNSLVAKAQEIASIIENFNSSMQNSIAAATESDTKSISIPTATVQNRFEGLGSVSGEQIEVGGTVNITYNPKTQALRDAKDNNQYLNPGIFFYNADAFRALKLVPGLAQKIGTGDTSNYQQVGWPSQIQEYASAGTPATLNTSPVVGVLQQQTLDYPVAYTSDDAKQLFVNMPNGSTSYVAYPTGLSDSMQRSSNTSLHEQELLQEPAWLSTQNGIMKMLKACLGDYSQIVGMGILDPCNEAIMANAKPGLAGANFDACNTYLQTIKDARAKYLQDNPPSGGAAA